MLEAEIYRTIKIYSLAVVRFNTKWEIMADFVQQTNRGLSKSFEIIVSIFRAIDRNGKSL